MRLLLALSIVTLSIYLVHARQIYGRQSDLIIGGNVLSSAPPHWNPTEHPKQPTEFWGNWPDGAPKPTNNWWGNLILDGGDQTVSTLPYELKALDDGLHVSSPNKVVDASYIETIFTDDWIVSAMEGLGASHELLRADALSATVRWEMGLVAPLVQGMPYVTVDYGQAGVPLTPMLTAIDDIATVNGDSSGTATGTKFNVELNNGMSWIIYTSEETTMTVSGSSIRGSGPLTGVVRLAALMPGASESVLDQYVGAVPVGGVVTASASGDTGTMTFSWQVEGTGELLTMALPHHMDVLSGVTAEDHVINTIKGDIVGVVGNTWTLTETLTTTEFFSQNPIAADKVAAIQSALEEDLSQEVVAGDPYFGGKQMAKLARLALIAEQVGDNDKIATFLDKARPALEGWLDGTNSDPLLYDTTWGGVVSTAGISDPYADFGMGYYNDHYFHFGYHIYTAAVIARNDPSWGSAYNDKVLQLVRDIAEPSGTDPNYPQSRHRDFYAGHSWANGIQTAFAESRNQESTSEAVNAYYGIYLYGLATGNDQVKDLGRILLAQETRAAQKYWQITTGNEIYPEPYASNKIVGILWSTKADYATWFGGNVEFIHCIQMIPFVPVSQELLPASWISEEYDVLSTAFDSADEAWRGYIIMAHAIIDKEAAWAEAQQLTFFDDGNTRSNTYYWIATRP